MLSFSERCFPVPSQGPLIRPGVGEVREVAPRSKLPGTGPKLSVSEIIPPPDGILTPGITPVPIPGVIEVVIRIVLVENLPLHSSEVTEVGGLATESSGNILFAEIWTNVGCPISVGLPKRAGHDLNSRFPVTAILAEAVIP